MSFLISSNRVPLKDRLEALEIQLEYVGELDEELAREKEELERKIGLIEAGLNALDEEQELPWVKAKYFQGKVERDNLKIVARLIIEGGRLYKKMASLKLEAIFLS